MIVLNLLCGNGHHFDGWFASSDAFREQCARALVHCPQCQSQTISQLPSAPHVVRSSSSSSPSANGRVSSRSSASAPALPPAAADSAAAGRAAEIAQTLHRALAAMARQAENVGERFPEEARRIHYDEAPARAIRGVATPDETRELLEEGIAVLPAPTPPDDEMH